MNKFLTTIGLALVTLAAIWGGFWLTNRNSQTTETLSMPAVTENRVEKLPATETQVQHAAMDENRVDKTAATGEDMKQTMHNQGQAMQDKAGEMADHGRNMVNKAGEMAGQMKNAAEDMTVAAGRAAKANEDLQKTVGAVKNGAADLANNVKAGTSEAANNIKKMAGQTTNTLAKEAEAVGISHEQAMLLPNLGNGWHVVGKASNGVKIKEMKSGTEYIAQSERKGSTKHTILRNPQTGAQVREFTAQIQ